MYVRQKAEHTKTEYADKNMQRQNMQKKNKKEQEGIRLDKIGVLYGRK